MIFACVLLASASRLIYNQKILREDILLVFAEKKINLRYQIKKKNSFWPCPRKQIPKKSLIYYNRKYAGKIKKRV